jgi:hypothetical protein
MRLAQVQPGLLTWGARRGGKVRCAADASHINAVLRTLLQPASPQRANASHPSAPLRLHLD